MHSLQLTTEIGVNLKIFVQKFDYLKMSTNTLIMASLSSIPIQIKLAPSIECSALWLCSRYSPISMSDSWEMWVNLCAQFDTCWNMNIVNKAIPVTACSTAAFRIAYFVGIPDVYIELILRKVCKFGQNELFGGRNCGKTAIG